MDNLVFKGQEHELVLPSGRKIVIRETNGDDDEMLSNLKDAKSGDNLTNFLANIVVSDSLIPVKTPTTVDVLAWPVSDRYYALFKQRIINQGHLMKFDFICQAEDCPSQKSGDKAIAMEQDLNEYDGDLADSNYKPVLVTSVKKYPNGTKSLVEFETSSKKKLRFKILNGILQKKQLDDTGANSNKNSQLYIREIELYTGGNWIILTHFKMFPSREMSEIRKLVEDSDPFFYPMVKFNCPHCKTPYSLPLFEIPVFYWPEERI